MQVYVSVYADGPTRVLRFADEKSTALLEAEQSILDLAARLKQVCSWLQHKTVDCLQAYSITWQPGISLVQRRQFPVEHISLY